MRSCRVLSCVRPVVRFFRAGADGRPTPEMEGRGDKWGLLVGFFIALVSVSSTKAHFTCIVSEWKRFMWGLFA